MSDRKRRSIPIRFPRLLHQRLARAAADRDVSINFLVNRAVTSFVGRLLPVDEVEWTRREPIDYEGLGKWFDTLTIDEQTAVMLLLDNPTFAAAIGDTG